MEGKSINGFVLHRLLGRGGMAEVWYAENAIHKPAAIKILSKNLADSVAIVDRFRQEAEIMVKLSHPNIRQVYDYVEIDGRPAIIMEYLKGDDLSERLKKGEHFSDEDLIKWWNQLVDALTYTHNKGIVHRDIKPGNIFIDENRNVKLLDFGIAKIKESISMTRTGTLMGTLMYMSPEQVMDSKHIGPESDIYSLAVTFVHLLTGKAPYERKADNDYAIRKGIVEEPLDISSIPEQWRNFLKPYLNKKAELRPTLTYFDTIKPKKNSGIKANVDKKNNKKIWLWMGLVMVFLLTLFIIVDVDKTEGTYQSSENVFSVSKKCKVYFTKGNLQYRTNNKYSCPWRFAPNQWDYIGKDNDSISRNTNCWIDLFGWGTGNNPTLCSERSSEYNTFNDWGDTYNDWVVPDSEDDPNYVHYQYRSLTREEWLYVFNERKTKTGMRYAKAKINNVCGVILLPDNWSNTVSVTLNECNVSDASYTSNIISQSQWMSEFDSLGAVFLPAAGMRTGQYSFGFCEYGVYWSSSSHQDFNVASSVYFDGKSLNAGNYLDPSGGFSVRLVYSADK